MNKFYQFNSLKYILSIIVFIKYSLWTLFFILQGKAIHLAIDTHTLRRQLVLTLVAFILVKMIVMFCDVIQKFTQEYCKNKFIKNQWHEKFPTRLYSDNKNNKNDLSSFIFDILPRLFDLEMTIATNRFTIIFIFALTFIVLIYNGFFISFISLLFIFFLNFMSKNIFTERINQYQSESYSSKIQILHWIDQYFLSYREISKNWQPQAIESWKELIYEKYYTIKNSEIFFYLFRDILSQIFVEMPFLISSSIVILGVYYHYLSITQLFVWIGFSQFMVNASNAYLENRVKTKQRLTLYVKTNEIMNFFDYKKYEHDDSESIHQTLSSDITLRDGTKNSLSLVTGIYHIQGVNGSGKSTLMNMILKYDRTSTLFENRQFSQLMAAVIPKNTRVIERDAVLFDYFNEFNAQVCGPFCVRSDLWKVQITHSIHSLLEINLANQWIEIFTSLEREYKIRKVKIFSSGEKVILSMMRFFASWHDKVNLLIVDECDSFLDTHKKKLFAETISVLSSQMAIYICTHASLVSY